MHAQILHPAIQESRFDQIESQAATSSEPPPAASTNVCWVVEFLARVSKISEIFA